MYDGHIYCKDYKEIKDMINDYINGEDIGCTIEELEQRIQELYDDGEIQATQYDDLMSYIVELQD